jgi:EamA domain-containing membrane protein RarD
VTSADYNLYNQEQAGMFGSGTNTVSSTGQEPHSLVVDPLFTDIINYDFALTAYSPAIDTGLFLDLSSDYYLNPIGNSPDIGVHEVQ